MRPIHFKDSKGLKYTFACTLAIIVIICMYHETKAFLNPSHKNRLNVINRNIVPGSRKVRYVSDVEQPSNDRDGDLRALRRFTESEDNGNNWISVWNSWGTIHRLYPGDFKRYTNQSNPRKFNSLNDIENDLALQAKEYINNYWELFKIREKDLLYKGTKLRGGIYYCSFDQYYNGVRVYGGGIVFRFDKNGNILLIDADTYPNINLSTHPAIGIDEAVNAAKDYFGVSNEGVRIGDIALFVLPIPNKDTVEYLLSWRIPVFMDSVNGGHAVFIDALSGEVILTYRLDRYGIKGRVSGLILPQYYNDPPKKVAFTNLKVYLLNQSNPINEYTMDSDPDWSRDGMWEFGTPIPQNVDDYGHAGCPDPDSGTTGQNVFGYNLIGDYTNLMRPKYLTTNTIYCTNKTGVVLTFYRWLGVQREYWESDSGDRSEYDRATIEVSSDTGKTWNVIWSNGTSQIEDGVYNPYKRIWEGWNLQFFDISELADKKDIVIRWGMGPTDGSGTFCGWNIDDVGLYETLDALSDPNGSFEFPNTDDVPLNILLAQLKGNYIEVYNEDGASVINNIRDIAGDTKSVIEFDFQIDQSHLKDFDEFNVFYHMNLLLDYIKRIDPAYDGMDKKDQTKVYVRYGDNYTNAFWSPENVICFGEGDCHKNGYRNFAHFSDIIYHEYAHAITDSFYSLFMPPLTSIRKTTDGEQTGPVFVTEFDAIHEAFSDYWACTINNDPQIGDGDFWISKRYVRNLDNQFKYPDDYGDDAYANSLILSGAMWETRESEGIGRGVADTLFHFARYGGATSFEDFLVDILIQDEISFDGEHTLALKDIFGWRGISRAPAAPNGLVAKAGNTYIDLQWRPGFDEDEVAGYYVYFRTENDIASDREDPSVRRDAGISNSYRLEGLTNGTTYVLKVTSYNIYNAESDDSDLVYATPYSNISNAALGSEGRILCFIETLL